ncbi:MAG: serine/threonine-protein kinase, partial [Myxococcota bacterium]
MKDGAEDPGGPSETLERQPDIPSAAVPDTLPRQTSSDDRPLPRDVPRTEPAMSSGELGRLLDDPAGPGDFPEVEREHYAVGEEFARGGLGRILEAQDHRLGRTVAIKELLSKDLRAQARFIREAKITARLEHPNIVPIHEAGHWPDGPRFYAMKLVRGTTLASRLEDAINDEERLRLVPHLIDVADAVAYAHSQGILHRDLKPSNVMVGPFGETVLIDWGLAKDLRDSESDIPSSSDGMSPSVFETSDGIVVGTPPYMPPEQARAQPLDERADVYALGAMLYHVLCGRRPYHDTHPREILSRVVHEPPIALEELTDELPSDLLAIVSKAMARDPRDRYRSAEEMAEELRRFNTGRLVRAHAYSSWELTRRFLRRNVGIVLTLLLASCVLIGLGRWSYVQISEERDIARRNERQAQAELKKFTLEKAKVLLASDPTEAMAWLKRLPPRTPQAATIAAEAADRGVAKLVLQGHTDVVNRVAITPDGQWGASVANDRTVRLWNLVDGTGRELPGHTDKVTQVAFDPAGRWLATGSHDRTVRLRRVKGNDERVLVGADSPIKALTFDRTGELIAAATEGGETIVWTIGGRRLHIFKAEGGGRYPTVAFVHGPQSGPAERIAVSGFGADVRLWSLRGEGHRRLLGPRRRTAGLAVSQDGRYLAAGAVDGSMRLWSLHNDAVRVLPGRPDRWSKVVFSPDGRYLAAGGLSRHVQMWSVGGGVAQILEGHDERISDLRFDPGGRRLLSASWDGTVRIWTGFGRDRRAVSKVLLGHSNAVSSIAVSLDGTQLLSGAWDKTLRLWFVRSDRQRVLRGHTVGVHGVAFGPQGRRVFSGGHDQQVRAWDLSTDESVVLGTHEDHIYRVQVSPNGRWLASSSDDRTVRLWNLETGDHQPLRGHDADVEEIAFSPNSRWVVSAGEDAMAWLWSVP